MLVVMAPCLGDPLGYLVSAHFTCIGSGSFTVSQKHCALINSYSALECEADYIHSGSSRTQCEESRQSLHCLDQLLKRMCVCVRVCVCVHACVCVCVCVC